ncbi:MAG TPA: lytic transglycosylase domain-containing protein [Chitinophagaceae bacterium]|nr:lytic transglycosylase domain-containing protein [Chitinophagaceae bacterium]
MTRIAYSLYTILFAVCVLISIESVARDTVTVITISDPNLIPKNAVIQRLPKQVADSTRFVQKPVLTQGEKPGNIGNLHVSKSIYGTYTDYILEYVKAYKDNFGQRIDRIKTKNKGYFALMDNVMRRYGLPRELKSLAIIESALNCNAVSSAGAVGPWQFMETTARELGLRVDGRTDERKDFYKSTHAAARYLKQLHGMFHDWLLVIASYNCGPAPVLRAINSGLGRSFWDIKPRLPKETQNHVMAFIATSSMIEKVCNVLGLGEYPKGAKAPRADFSAFQKSADDLDVSDDADTNKPAFTQEELDKMAILKVKGAYKIQAIAQLLNEDPVRLKRWNPSFETELLSSSSPVHLRIPIEKLEQFILQKDKILQASRKY